MNNLSLNSKKMLKTKLSALIVIALFAVSLTVTAANTAPANAASVPSGVTIGPPQLAYTGGAVPTGVTPDVTLQTTPYISFSPNPIGVGQSLLVNVWLQPSTSVSRAHTTFTVTITKPDKTVLTVGPFCSYEGDATGWFNYVPDAAGNYTLQFNFGGDYYPAGTYTEGVVNSTATTTVSSAAKYVATQSCYYAPSSTATYTLVVQQNFVSSWPVSTLPTDYWTRPIVPDNREWWVIGGNSPFNYRGGGSYWPADTNTYASNYFFTPYVQGPTSCHIAWRAAGAASTGIQGGGENTQWAAPVNYDDSFSPASGAYNAGPGTDGNPAIAFEGRLYGKVMSVFNGVPMYVWQCTDIRTGKVIWQQPWTAQMPTMISSSFITPLVPGATERADRLQTYLIYIGGGYLTKYDPTNGALVSNDSISPLTTATVYNDPFALSVQNIGTTAAPNYRLINWTIVGTGGIGARVMSNITWPFSSVGTADYDSMISCATYSANLPATGVASIVYIAAANLVTGQLLWNKTTGIGYPIYSGSTTIADHGKLAIRMDNGFWYAWDLQSGTQVWQSSLSSYPWGTFGAYGVQSAYGLIFYEQYDGVVAYNWTNGQVAWHYSNPAVDFETPYLTNGTGNADGSTQGYSYFSQGIVADGMLYVYNLEHSPSAPLTRGWKTTAINATTGAQVWQILGSMAPGIVSDGYLTACNWYDGYMYVFGMGQSATTVTAPLTTVQQGTAVLIQGTVMDKSPATSTSPHYASGELVPCVSDDSMTTWMNYLYMQTPIGGLWGNETITGVPVTLTAIGSDGTVYNIGSATTNGYYGTFATTWTPPKQDTYTITATFAGDDSYGSSSSATAVNIGPAASATPAPTATAALNLATNSDIMTYIVGATIAIIIAIVLVGLLIVRKH